MQTKNLLPDGQHLRCDRIRWDGSQAAVLVSGAGPTGTCSKCGRPSSRVHSHYQRQLQDLPWQGIAIGMLWRSCRCFCDNDDCRQKIFTERLPELAAPHGRKTQRLISTLRALALACGGEVGAQPAQRLEMPTNVVNGVTGFVGARLSQFSVSLSGNSPFLNYAPSVVPEPSTLVIWSLLGGGALAWRRRRKPAPATTEPQPAANV